MNKVAKLVIIDPTGAHLMMYRSNHPQFSNDPDLPGGTVEEGEESLAGMVREVKEEAGIDIDASAIKKVYEGTEYSRSGTHYTLYTAQVSERPSVEMSWEHSAYEWLDRDAFLQVAKGAKDTYMHMTYHTLK